MSTPSSIIRSAQSARKKRRAYEDAVAAFEYDLSPKGQDDFERYVAHINQRIETTADPSEILSYQKKYYSAQTAHFSHEIQRESIGVLEGSSSLIDKSNKMYTLYQQALATGDLDLAQGLRLQLDQLDLSIQAQQASYAASAEKMAKAQVTSINAFVDRILKDPRASENTNGEYTSVAELNRLVEEEGKAGYEKVVKIGREMAKARGEELPEGAGFWDAQAALILMVRQAYNDSAEILEAAGDVEGAEEYRRKVDDIDYGYEKFDIGMGEDMSFHEVEKFRRAEAAGTNITGVVNTGETNADGSVKWGIDRQPITDYAWTKDYDGTWQIEPLGVEKGFEDSFTAPLLDDNDQPIKNAKGEDLNMERLLNQAGYELGGEQNGQMKIRVTDRTRIRGEREGVLYDLASRVAGTGPIEKLREIPGFGNNSFFVSMTENPGEVVFRSEDGKTAYTINAKTGVVAELAKPNEKPGTSTRPDRAGEEIAKALSATNEFQKQRALDLVAQTSNPLEQARIMNARKPEPLDPAQGNFSIGASTRNPAQAPKPKTPSAPRTGFIYNMERAVRNDLSRREQEKKKTATTSTNTGGFTKNLANTLLGR